jgi:hypothetical protein
VTHDHLELGGAALLYVALLWSLAQLFGTTDRHVEDEEPDLPAAAFIVFFTYFIVIVLSIGQVGLRVTIG